MTTVNLRTMVLNSSYQPVSIFPEILTISARDAIKSALSGGCDILSVYDRPIMGPRGHIETKELGMLFWPAVIANKHSHRRRETGELKFSKDYLYVRENFKCYWCDTPLKYSNFTEDHLMPVSRGGDKRSWLNSVCSCTACNAAKDNNLPVGRWEPKKKVWMPTFFELLEIRKKHPLIVDHESWLQFLPKFESTVYLKTVDGMKVINQ